jgi:thiol-disulfide isomerase/thioredoxin
MKTIKIITFLVALNISAMAQSPDFIREIDKKTDKVCLRGLLKFEDILNETTYTWMQKGMESYEPNKAIVERLRKVLPTYRFVVFIGTWCGDTQELLPQYYKTMKLAGFDFNALQLYGVNRNKEAINIESKLYNITKVPTIIIMERFREVGRITETVNKSIEEDLLNIMVKDLRNMEK